MKTKTVHHIHSGGLHHPALMSAQERNRRVREALKDVPSRSRVLIPDFLEPVFTISLVLKARARRLVPVWWDSMSREYKLFPRS